MMIEMTINDDRDDYNYLLNWMIAIQLKIKIIFKRQSNISTAQPFIYPCLVSQKQSHLKSDYCHTATKREIHPSQFIINPFPTQPSSIHLSSTINHLIDTYSKQYLFPGCTVNKTIELNVGKIVLLGTEDGIPWLLLGWSELNLSCSGYNSREPPS